MKCEWKRILLGRKRSDWCLVYYVDPKDGKHHGSLCGCGARVPPTVDYKRRIARRRLVRELLKTTNEG